MGKIVVDYRSDGKDKWETIVYFPSKKHAENASKIFQKIFKHRKFAKNISTRKNRVIIPAYILEDTILKIVEENMIF